MFNKNKKQFINIIQQNKQLKLDYKILQDDKILKEEQSSFLTPDEKLPTDAKFKLNALQKNISHTYLTSLVESENQHIISTNNVDVISYDAIKIGNFHSIIIPKNDITSTSRYYNETGIDYILSPYTILEKYLEDNGKKNSLNFFIYNNIIYAIVFNGNVELTLTKTKTLTPFESTQDESFLEDDIVGQKLYEEVNFLEIQEFIDSTIEEYYEQNSDNDFLEHIEIIYTLKPLSEEQIDFLQETLMIPITYKAVNLEKYLDQITQDSDVKEYSFITPRIKKEDKSIYVWITLTVLSILIGIAVFYFKLNDKEQNNETIEKPKQIKVEKKKEINDIESSSVSLPNHKMINDNNVQSIQMLFGVLPYDAVLKDVEISKNSSTFVTNFLINSKSLLDMQSKLKNIYVDSKILLERKNKVIVNTIIQNNKIMEKYNLPIDIKNIKYKKYKFLSTSKATTYLKGLGIKNSALKLESKDYDNILSYTFSAVSHISKPEDFFSFINTLNSQKLSIELLFPIKFSKTNTDIEVKYRLKINQQLPKQVEPKK